MSEEVDRGDMGRAEAHGMQRLQQRSGQERRAIAMKPQRNTAARPANMSSLAAPQSAMIGPEMANRATSVRTPTDQSTPIIPSEMPCPPN
jgi:hypothetical protein